MKMKKNPKPPFPWGMWTPSNITIPRLTQLTTPNDSSIGFLKSQLNSKLTAASEEERILKIGQHLTKLWTPV